MDVDRCLGLLYACNQSCNPFIGVREHDRLYRLARKLERHYFKPDAMPSGYYYLDRKAAYREYRSYSEARSWAAHYLRVIKEGRTS
jgi:hypothetical protein